MSLTASQYMDFSKEISGDVNECDFCINVWKTFVTQ